MLWADAVKKAGTTDGAAVAKVLESNQFDLLTGNLTYSSADTGHYPLKAAALVALKDAKPEFLGWRKPENPPAP
jgi:branched-chain amino acid transport system substrate-binding protein